MSEVAATKRMARQLHARATKTSGHNRKLLEHNSMLTKLLQAIVARSGRERVTLSELERVRDIRTLAIVPDERGKCVVLELLGEHSDAPPDAGRCPECGSAVSSHEPHDDRCSRADDGEEVAEDA